MALIELVDYNETYNTEKKSKSTRRSRRGRSGNKAATPAPVETQASNEEE